MGNVSATKLSVEVMPEVLVRQDNKFLLVKGSEKGNIFWWPPGAYWINAGVLHLHKLDPESWIRATLAKQINTNVIDVSLAGVSQPQDDHAPVLIYQAKISGEPEPNLTLGFDEARFFSINEFPENIGRDKVHENWLRGVIDQLPAVV